MFEEIFQGRLLRIISQSISEKEVVEIRLRIGREPAVFCCREKIKLQFEGVPYKICVQDINKVLEVCSNFSLYSVNEEIVQGFIPQKNMRVGIAGVGVVENGKLITVKDIMYIVLRFPHQIKDVAKELRLQVADRVLKNTLIISPPGAGKTTLLRELARHASEKYNTVIIDERFEIACAFNGAPTLDIGDSEVISGIKKTVAYENAVRSLNPQIIVTDELFKNEEIEAICDIVRSGVKVFATLHGKNVESIKSNIAFKALFDIFEFAVTLSSEPKIGTITEAVEL